MSEKKLIFDEYYNIINPETGEMLDNTQIIDLYNSLYEENIILKEQIILLEKNRKILNKWIDEYVDKFTEVWRIVEPYRRV